MFRSNWVATIGRLQNQFSGLQPTFFNACIFYFEIFMFYLNIDEIIFDINYYVFIIYGKSKHCFVQLVIVI